TTQPHTLSLHDALPIYFVATAKIRLRPNEKDLAEKAGFVVVGEDYSQLFIRRDNGVFHLYYGSCMKSYAGNEESTRLLTDLSDRSEEHTSELQSRENIV